MSDNQHLTTNRQQPAAYPTSPWTEVYQAASQTTEQTTAMPAAHTDFRDETQQPTRDALSVSYN